ncbi:MAG: hypothetical protein GAK37_00921 [Pseudomonas sp.]|nr:MAG: hypothetical protein GAK37_00921 [Pseudomonas sp.]
MGKRKEIWPTEREIRLRFILLAVIEVACDQGIPVERLLLSYVSLRNTLSETQLIDTLREVLDLEPMEGFRFLLGSEADRLLRKISATLC